MAQETSLTSIIPESSHDGTTLKVNEKTKKVVYSAEEPASQRLIAQVGFNKKNGVLNFVRANGEIVSVTGFLTSAQFGRGLRGNKGKTGKAGKTGFDGRDGKKGKTGCEGPIGATGITGESGLDGEDGEIGITGNMGPMGEQGPEGLAGIIGIAGDQGPQGQSGPDCIVGPVGEQGPQPKEVVYYGTDFPPDDYFVWAIPYTQGQSEEPVADLDEMSGDVDDESSNMTLVVDDTYGGSLVLQLKNFTGGKGPFTYKWTDTDGSFSDPSISVGNSGTTSTSLELKALHSVDKGDTETLSGVVDLEIRDSGTNKYLNITGIKFSFTATNNQQETSTNTGSGGGAVVGGGGCLVVDTPVYLKDKTKLKVGDIQIGDALIGYEVDGMVDGSDPDWAKWTTKSTKGKHHTVIVKNALRSWMHSYYRINNDVGITIQHELFVQKGTVWGWHCADTLELGDNLLDIDGNPVPIESIEFVEQKTKVVVLDVEDIDTYFVGTSRILVHNIENAKVNKV